MKPNKLKVKDKLRDEKENKLSRLLLLGLLCRKLGTRCTCCTPWLLCIERRTDFLWPLVDGQRAYSDFVFRSLRARILSLEVSTAQLSCCLDMTVMVCASLLFCLLCIVVGFKLLT